MKCGDVHASPPPALLQARVLAYAVLPRSVPFAGDDSIFVAREGGPLVPLGRVPRLAICEEAGGGIQLLFCEGTWRNVASTPHKTVAEAKARAERIYPDSSRCWVAARVTRAQAAKYLDQVWARYRCLFCLKTPLEHDEPVLKKGRGRICGACVRGSPQPSRKRRVGDTTVQLPVPGDVGANAPSRLNRDVMRLSGSDEWASRPDERVPRGGPACRSACPC